MMPNMAETINKLRIWKPALSPDDLRMSERALAQGIYRMLAEGTQSIEARDLIWWLFEEATETWGRLPDKERSWGILRAMWPGIALPSEDCRTLEWEVSLGLLRDPTLADKEAYTPHFQPTDPTAVDRAEIVYKWLLFVRTKNPKRDKLIFLAMAGKGGMAAARRAMGKRTSDARLYQVRDMLLKQIAFGLKDALDQTCQIL